MRRTATLLISLSVLLCGCFGGSDNDPQTLAEQWNTPDKLWTETELQQLSKGQNLYKATCAGCHLASGEGQLTIGAPPLKGSHLLTGELQRAINTIRNGRGTMPAFGNALTDDKLAAIMSYVSNAWGNGRGSIVQIEDRD